MEKVIPSFQYEPLILILELKISYEEEERGNIYGGRLSRTRIEEELANIEEERIVLKGSMGV
jgi:hypothetical protein